MPEDGTTERTSDAEAPAATNWPRNMDARVRRVGGATMEVTVELGRVRIPLEKVLQAEPGSVFETPKPSGQPLDILVNGALYAKGEAVVIGDNLAIRVTDLVTPNR